MSHVVATCHAVKKSPMDRMRRAGRRQPASRRSAGVSACAIVAPKSGAIPTFGAVATYFATPSFFASSSERTFPPFLVANVSASSFQAKATSEAIAALPLPPAT